MIIIDRRCRLTFTEYVELKVQCKGNILLSGDKELLIYIENIRDIEQIFAKNIHIFTTHLAQLFSSKRYVVTVAIITHTVHYQVIFPNRKEKIDYDLD